MHARNRAHARQRGFTLIEIMVVVVILGILASIVGPMILGRPDEARVVKAKQDIQALSAALDMYKLDNFRYPGTDLGLEALVTQPAGDDAPNWNQYIKKLSKDPWGRDYVYMSPGENGDFDVYSLGRDGAPGGEGPDADIGNWDE